MYRFRKSAEAVRNGDLSVNFNVRKTDEMRETATSLEEMIESLRAGVRKMKKLAEQGNTSEIKNILAKYKT
jgi:methyl-accepting chemotaxis protein